MQQNFIQVHATTTPAVCMPLVNSVFLVTPVVVVFGAKVLTDVFRKRNSPVAVNTKLSSASHVPGHVTTVRDVQSVFLKIIVVGVGLQLRKTASALRVDQQDQEK